MRSNEPMAWLSSQGDVRLYEPIVFNDGVTWAYVPLAFAEEVHHNLMPRPVHQNPVSRAFGRA